MDDLISRAVAVEALEQRKDKTGKGVVEAFYNTVIENNIATLEKLPAVQLPEHRLDWIWIPTAERLPKSESDVLALCTVKCFDGSTRFYICIAFYAPEKTVRGSLNLDDLELVYDEETDEYYWPEGWYEVVHNWDDYGAVRIDDPVTCWMPLPKQPKEA